MFNNYQAVLQLKAMEETSFRTKATTCMPYIY